MSSNTELSRDIFLTLWRKFAIEDCSRFWVVIFIQFYTLMGKLLVWFSDYCYLLCTVQSRHVFFLHIKFMIGLWLIIYNIKIYRELLLCNLFSLIQFVVQPTLFTISSPENCVVGYCLCEFQYTWCICTNTMEPKILRWYLRTRGGHRHFEA